MFNRILVAITLPWTFGCSIDAGIGTASSTLSDGLSGASFSISAPFIVRNITNDGVVTDTNQNQFEISGVCKYDADVIAVTSSGNPLDSTTCNNGAWSSSLDLSANSDTTIPLEITSGSFSTTLSLPRKLSPNAFDILVNLNCVGSSSCLQPSNAASPASSPFAIPIQISCDSQKAVTLRSFGYDAGTWNLNTSELSNESKICDRQGRAVFYIDATMASCSTVSSGGCTTETCRLNVKANQNNQESDEEDIEVLVQNICAM